MSADSIVVDFNVFEYNTSHFISRLKSLTMDGLDLKRVEEAPCVRLVVTLIKSSFIEQRAREE